MLFTSEKGSTADVLQAVDRATLVQLKGATARGYAFDKRYSMDDSSDLIYKQCIEKLVENIFKVTRPYDSEMQRKQLVEIFPG